METRADKIERLIDETAPHVAVVFNGREPRTIGKLDGSHRETDIREIGQLVDTMLIGQHLSARAISRAVVNGKYCIIAHGN